MEKHPITQEILSILDKNSCWYETFEHEPVRTSEEAAKTRPGYTLQQGAKAIIIRAKISGGDKRFLMLVMPADQKFSNDKVKALLGAKDIRFATEEEVAEITKGVIPGAVPPFGNLFGLEVISDKTLYNNDKIVFNAGERTFSVAINSEDYKRVVAPRLENIV